MNGKKRGGESRFIKRERKRDEYGERDGFIERETGQADRQTLEDT